MFSALFISRPKLALVISLVLTIMGAIGYLVLPVAQFPDITPPVVSVTTPIPEPMPKPWKIPLPPRSRRR